MNNDYLFDGVGENAEIQELEELLSGFRYVETAPPDLPATNIIPVTATNVWRRRFSLVFAFGSALAVIAIAAIYLQTIRVSQPARTEQAIVPSAGVESSSAPVTSDIPHDVRVPEVKPDQTVPENRRAVRPSLVSYRTARPKAIRPLLAKNQQVMLTPEERYAYNQVKLALSITGAKLRTVEDTINQVENKGVSPSQR